MSLYGETFVTLQRYLHFLSTVHYEQFVDGPTLVATVNPALVFGVPKENMGEIFQSWMSHYKTLHTMLA